MNLNLLRKQLKDSFKNRALFYYHIYQELKKALGIKKAQKLLASAIYNRGCEIGRAAYLKAAQKKDFKKIADIFVKTSPDNGNLFHPKKIKADKNKCIVTMSTCPLLEAWKEKGLSKKERVILCDLASYVDFGTFESVGLKVKFEGKLAKGDKTCRLNIS